MAALITLALSGSALAAGGNSGLTISPLRSYPTQDPGVTTSSFVQITNSSKLPVEVDLGTQLFSTIDESYDYAFAPVGSQDWIRLASADINLAPGALQKVNYDVAVPASAKPGGYYFTIMATTKEPASSVNFTVLERVVSLIYLQVNGNITHKVSLLGIDIPLVTTNQNAPISARLSNSGGSHERAALALTSHYWPWGKPSNSVLQGLVLPSTIRRLSGTLPLNNLPGLYKTTVSFTPVQGGTTKTTHYILYFPVWFMIFIVFAISYLALRWPAARAKLGLKKIN